MKRIGILHHPKIPQSLLLTNEICGWLAARGLCHWHGSAWDEAVVEQEIDNLDLLLTLGGDGTILRAARMGACHGVPILGLNLGRLGFLAELQPEGWQSRLSQMLAGDYWVEDGLIISTPTGSTAYALAVGGPILPPELHNILVIPIAPHLSLDRAVVLAEGSTVSVGVSTDHTAILTIDGQFEVELQDEDMVVIKASPHRACFIRMQEPTYFYRTLMARLRPAGHE
jgi:NAD+ kinase